jgi:GT2 family glycosyltransferase
MKVSLVILNYNTRDITDVCIDLALKAVKYCEKTTKNTAEIIVVDNASSDGSVEMIKKKYPQIKLIVNPTNAGVSIGYNVGMRASKGSDFILLLNSDLYLEEDSIANSFDFMEKNPDCDVMICKLFNAEHKFETYGGHLPTPKRTIFWLLGFESIPFIKDRIKKIYGYNKDLYKKDFQVEWAPTCFYFLKYAVFRETGGNDERIFLYMDDLEWCKRIHDAGFKFLFTPKFTSTHLCGASTDKKFHKLYILQRQVQGIKYYQKKHHPKTLGIVMVFLYFGFGMRSLAYLLIGQHDSAKIYLQSLTQLLPDL